jgi:hypothetical protein
LSSRRTQPGAPHARAAFAGNQIADRLALAERGASVTV